MRNKTRLNIEKKTKKNRFYFYRIFLTRLKDRGRDRKIDRYIDRQRKERDELDVT